MTSVTAKAYFFLYNALIQKNYHSGIQDRRDAYGQQGYSRCARRKPISARHPRTLGSGERNLLETMGGTYRQTESLHLDMGTDPRIRGVDDVGDDRRPAQPDRLSLLGQRNLHTRSTAGTRRCNRTPLLHLPPRNRRRAQLDVHLDRPAAHPSDRSRERSHRHCNNL